MLVRIVQFPYDILKVMRENPKVCRYLDIALQHSSDNVLGLMRHGIDRKQTVELINRIREEVPDITLRTTMLVGHSGETEADMDDLKAFVKEMKFERLGVFPYSNEDFYFGRSEFDSYEVDPEVLISSQNFDLQIGQMCDVEVTDVEDYDLFAIVV